jgi:hypothetical protein
MDYADAASDYEKAIELDPSRTSQLRPELEKIQAMMR